jgi:hypothetical protein
MHEMAQSLTPSLRYRFGTNQDGTMTTAYTRAELDELEHIFADRIPRLATQADLRTAPRVSAVTMTGSSGGIVFMFKLLDGRFLTANLNVVVAVELARGIATAADHGDWEKAELFYRRDPSMRTPTRRDAEAATPIVSLTTAGAGPEMLIHFAAINPDQTIMIGLFQDIGAEILIGIQAAGDLAGWWTEDGALMPK